MKEANHISAAFDLVFLGTCACDFSPKLETEFKNTFDLDARRSSALLLNGSTLVDCGNHTLDSLRISGKETAGITALFLTHLHSDHFNAGNVAAIAEKRKEPLRLWVREDAVLPPIANTVVVKMTPYQRYEVGSGLFVTGLLANHDADVFPQHFLFEREGKKIFYGCDGAWMLNPTYYHLHNAALDLAILDCTSGDYAGDYRMAEHNSIPMIRLMLPSLKSFGIVTEKTEIYFSHLAPSLHKPHKETAKIAREMGAKVAYDGLRITV